jgi:hypothetical protein
MSKKHFEAIARTIRFQVDAADTYVRGILRDLADDLCTEFRAANPNFDRDRFMKACGF